MGMHGLIAQERMHEDQKVFKRCCEQELAEIQQILKSFAKFSREELKQQSETLKQHSMVLQRSSTLSAASKRESIRSSRLQARQDASFGQSSQVTPTHEVIETPPRRILRAGSHCL